jgi:hypothetical protein
MAGTKGAVVRGTLDNYEVVNGTAGHVLTSNGAGSAPSFQAAAGGGSYTDEEAQDAVGTILTDTATVNFTYTDATPAITADVNDDSITYDKLQNISATDRLLGRDTAGSGNAEELTVGGGVEFTGSGGIQTSAFTGDVTKSAGGTALTIANDAVTYAKMQNISATQRVLGRNTSGAGDTEEVTLTQLLDWIGSAAQGDILYRGAASWSRLAAGTLGQFLKTNGSGANPEWATVEASGGGGHLHGLMRILGDGATTTFNLLDIAEYLEHVGVGGSFLDPTTFTLSSDGSQITFDAAPADDAVITMEYVIAGL